MKISESTLKVPTQEIEKTDIEMPRSMLKPQQAATATPSIFIEKPIPVQEKSAAEAPPISASVFAPELNEPPPIEAEPRTASFPEEAPSVFTPEPIEEKPAAAEQQEKVFDAPSVFAPQNNQPTPLQKHASHYETMMRFAAVELEGTLKM